MNPEVRLVAFDLDHTLLNCNSSFAFGKFLYRTSRLPLAKALVLAAFYFAHTLRLISVLKLHQLSCEVLFAGKTRQTLDRWVSEFCDTHLSEMVDKQIADILAESLAHGIRVCVLSTSPDFIVLPIARRLGVELAIGTRYAGDPITSVAELVQGSQKAETLRREASRLGISRMATAAYTDSYADLALLEAAGNPVAVRPDRRLHRVARQRGWKVLN